MLNPYAAERILKAFDALRDEIARAITPPDASFVSPIWLTGYDTVLGYLAKVAPDYLESLYDPAACTVRDGFWLTHRARERNLTVIKVLAPQVMRDKGVEFLNAYPISLLEERLGGFHV